MKKRKKSCGNDLLNLCKVLDTDYIEYGGKITRADDKCFYFDCSAGCKHFIPLYDKTSCDMNLDFGVCTNAKSKRCGLLTFEHQAGFGCFEAEDYNYD